jgi:hypothetical protein
MNPAQIRRVNWCCNMCGENIRSMACICARRIESRMVPDDITVRKFPVNFDTAVGNHHLALIDGEEIAEGDEHFTDVNRRNERLAQETFEASIKVKNTFCLVNLFWVGRQFQLQVANP